MQAKIVVLTTGGTIAMRHDPAKGGAVPAISGSELIEAVPALKELCDLEVVEIGNIPSFHATPESMLHISATAKKILDRDDVTGVVVTHGTDTLEETAYFLHHTISSDKPICITGAMRSATDSSSDGPHNIYCAVKAACSPLLKGIGTVVVMNEEIHAAEHVIKMHRSALQTFASPNAGPLGTVDKSGVRIRTRPAATTVFNPQSPLPTVPIVKVYTGMDTDWLDVFVNAAVDGIVIEGFGLGNVPEKIVPWIRRMLDAGIPVLASSRVPSGSTRKDYAIEGGAGHLASLGVLLAGELSSQKARLKLILALTRTREARELASIFSCCAH